MGIVSNRRAERRERQALAYEEERYQRALDPRNVVADFRQKLHEDPEFKEDFVDAIRNGHEKARHKSRDMYDRYSSESSDDTDLARMEVVAEFAGGAALGILDAMRIYVDNDDVTPEEFITMVTDSVAEFAWSAFCQSGFNEQIMKNKALAYHIKGVGTIENWSQLRDHSSDPATQADAFVAMYEGGEST